jgi:hypothetical protein
LVWRCHRGKEKTNPDGSFTRDTKGSDGNNQRQWQSKKMASGERFDIYTTDWGGKSYYRAGGDGNALPYDPTQLQNNKDIKFDNHKDAQGNDHWYVAGGTGQELGYDPTKDGGQLNAVY